MSNHTPGPWRLSKLGFAENDGSIPVLSATEGDETAKRICTVSFQSKAKRGEAYRTPCADRDANARLIAAAPELLEALKELSFDAFEDAHPEAVKKARAAIAKAEGQT